MSRRSIHFWILLVALAGIALFIWLILRNDAGAIFSAVATARWYLLLIVVVHVVPLVLDAGAWQVLFPRSHRPGLAYLTYLRWIGEAVSTLLPATQLGGDIIRARLAAKRNQKLEIDNRNPELVISLPLSAASVLADITVSVLSQIIFTLIGLMLLASLTGKSGITGPAIAGSALAVLAIGAFYALQRYGLFRMLAAMVARIASSAAWQSLVAHGENLDQHIRDIYARHKAILGSTLLTLVSWFTSAGEVYIALYALGLADGPEAFSYAVALEAVGQGIRSAAFFVPSGIGIQEAGYLGVGAALGIPAEAALALSLIRRARELATGIPGLVAWHVTESRRLLAGSPGASQRTRPLVKEG